MKQDDEEIFMEDLHAELPGIGVIASEEQGIAGFAFEDDAPLPCAISVSSSGNPFVIRIHGDMDIHSFAFLAKRIGRIIELLTIRSNGALRALVIDLNYCNYLDSRGMGLLIKTARDLQTIEGRLSLSHLSPKVHKVFTLTGMDKILTVIP